jgi:uncharacterized protein
VDFVIYGGNTFTAVEVKHTKVTKPLDFSGLTSFGDDYPEAKLILLYLGSLVYEHKKILVLPLETFLRNPGKYI